MAKKPRQPRQVTSADGKGIPGGVFPDGGGRGRKQNRNLGGSNWNDTARYDHRGLLTHIKKEYQDTDNKGKVVTKEEWVKVSKQKSKRSREESETRHIADAALCRRQVVLHKIPNLLEGKQVMNDDADSRQVHVFCKELKYGHLKMRPGVIKGTERQVYNKRNPNEIPITVTLVDEEWANALLIAAEAAEIRGKRPEHLSLRGMGFLRESLNLRERRQIAKRNEYQQSGRAQGKKNIKNLVANTKKGPDYWDNVTWDYDDDTPPIQVSNPSQVSNSPPSGNTPEVTTSTSAPSPPQDEVVMEEGMEVTEHEEDQNGNTDGNQTTPTPPYVGEEEDVMEAIQRVSDEMQKAEAEKQQNARRLRKMQELATEKESQKQKQAELEKARGVKLNAAVLAAKANEGK